MSTVEPKASIGHQKLWQLHGLAKDSGQVALAHEIADLIAASSGGEELAASVGLPDRETIHAQVLMRPGNVRTSVENVDDVVAALSALGVLRVAPVSQLAKPRISPCGVQMVDCPECGNQWDHFFTCGYEVGPAAEPTTDTVGANS